jgi:hypothetical protein
LVLHRVLDEDTENELTELIEGRIVNIFYLFSQAENYVKEMVADRQVLKSVLKALRRMTPSHQITMLKFIKNLSMLTTTLEALHSADAIDFLIDLLSASMKRGQTHFREISNQVLNTMFNLCRLSKDRQEYAAVNGIIPLLLKIMKTERPPKEFALPILCDMAHSGSKGRRFLWQNKGLDFYVSLLADQYWQVTALDAIFVWLQEETAKVEGYLLNANFTPAIIACFNTAKINAFDPNLLEPLLKVIRLSPSLAASLAKSEMYSGVAQKLTHKKAVVRLNLLRLVRIILDAREIDYFSSPRDKQLRSLLEEIQTLAEKDSAVLVRNLASELVRSHIGGNTEQTLPASSASTSNGSDRARPRRIYTPPSLQNSASVPLTPTHTSRPLLQASTSAAAYIEVAASPKRSGPNAPHLERDSNLYRPRSRDGGTGSSIPRRVSGESQTSLNGKSRSSRQSQVYPNGHASRPSLSGARSDLTGLRSERSESQLSNKENVSRHVRQSPDNIGSGTAPRGGLGASRTGASASLGKQRRSRAPSEGTNAGAARRWGA